MQCVGVAVTGAIKGDDGVGFGQFTCQFKGKVAHVATRAVNKHDGRAAAFDHVMNAGAFNGDKLTKGWVVAFCGGVVAAAFPSGCSCN